MEPVEAGGAWWLPSTPDRRVPGTLRITNRGEITLTLIGHLDKPSSVAASGGSVRATRESLARSGRYPRVHGEAGQTGYTLDQGIRTFRSGLGHAVPSETIKFRQAFTDVWFDDNDPFNFDRVVFDLQWLTEWINESGLSESTTISQRGVGGQLSVTGKLLPSRRVRVGSGRSVYLRHMLAWS